MSYLTKDEIRIGMRVRGDYFRAGDYVEVIFLGNDRFFGQFYSRTRNDIDPEAAYEYDFGWTEIIPEPEPVDVRLELILLQEELISLRQRAMAGGPIIDFARIVERLLELLQEQYQ